MDKINPIDYKNYIPYIDKMGCGTVYPLSVAEMIQQGDVFADHHSVLFWHYCGFAFIYGDHDESFLNDVYKKFINSIRSRRFILFISDEKTRDFFIKKDNIMLERRYFFEYRKSVPANNQALPLNLKLCEISQELLYRINGNVTPLFSWDNSSDFFEKGKGYCILDGETVAAWAFTAAISDEEIDIGIETSAEYQHCGLGAVVSDKMIRYCFQQNKRPVWACHSNNIASQKLAEKAGFEKVSECFTLKRR